jgi:hypothetical protein
VRTWLALGIVQVKWTDTVVDIVVRRLPYANAKVVFSSSTCCTTRDSVKY